MMVGLIEQHNIMWLSEQKPDVFAYKLKLILLPKLIATLNNYVAMNVHCLHWLMSTGLLLQWFLPAI